MFTVIAAAASVNLVHDTVQASIADAGDIHAGFIAVDADNRAIKYRDRPLNWGGSTMLCTREAQFEFSEQGDCGARGLNANGYDRIDMTAGTGKTIRFGMP